MTSAAALGSLWLAVPVALLAGVISFVSPCVLPLVPGYLGYVSGMATGDRPGRRRLVTGVALFVLGFTVVFVVTGAAFGALGFIIRPWIGSVARVLGAVIIVLGLVFIGLFGFAQRNIKPHWRAATGLAGAPLLGVIFALGWTPCLGPTLVAINSISIDQGDPVRGGFLALIYALGLGIPFLLIALGLGWATTSMQWLRRHIRTINIIGGAVLILIGVLMVTGLWQLLMSNLTAVVNGFVPLL